MFHQFEDRSDCASVQRRRAVGPARIAVIIWAFGLSWIGEASAARQSDDEACEMAARQAAEHFNVPLDILNAVLEVESGRFVTSRVTAWPWSINHAGRSLRFQTRAAAADFLRRQINSGQTNLDVGCFQVNVYWHGRSFQTPEHMLDPVENATYAAAFLAQLHQEFAGWDGAVGAYHSRTEKHARPYRSRVVAALNRLTDRRAAPARAQPSASSQTDHRRSNQYPLLQASGDVRGTAGSLVPTVGQIPTRKPMF